MHLKVQNHENEVKLKERFIEFLLLINWRWQKHFESDQESKDNRVN